MGSTPRDGPEQPQALNAETPGEVAVLTQHATALATHLPGHGSVDFAYTADGRWIFLDAARAEVWWHPTDCPIVNDP